MIEYDAIVEDLYRCVGCYACEVACRKENNLPEDEAWIKVSIIGPEKVDGKLTMDFIVSVTQDCTLCKKRLEKGLKPFCVSVCPTQALIYCSTTPELLSILKKSRIQVLKIEEKI